MLNYSYECTVEPGISDYEMIGLTILMSDAIRGREHLSFRYIERPDDVPILENLDFHYSGVERIFQGSTMSNDDIWI